MDDVHLCAAYVQTQPLLNFLVPPGLMTADERCTLEFWQKVRSCCCTCLCSPACSTGAAASLRLTSVCLKEEFCLQPFFNKWRHTAALQSEHW